MTRLITTLVLLAATIAVKAQTFTDHLQQGTAGGGTVVVVQSKEIGYLVNNVKPEPEPASEPKPASRPASKPIKKQAPKIENSAEEDLNNENEASTESRRKVMVGQKVRGYRVQVFSGGNSRQDKENAQEAGNAMKAAFPGQPVFVHFYSPRWTCRIGNFTDRNDAEECLKKVRAMGYAQACIVSGTITAR